MRLLPDAATGYRGKHPAMALLGFTQFLHKLCFIAPVQKLNGLIFAKPSMPNCLTI
jgi:hypothetical protein